MTVKHDLIAARALIDTPEKYKNLKLSRAVYEATSGTNAAERYLAAMRELSKHRLRGIGFKSDITRLNRAIAATEQEGV